MAVRWNGMMQSLSTAHNPLCVTGRLGREKNKVIKRARGGGGGWEKGTKNKEVLPPRARHLGRFNKRAGTSVDDCARKSNNWLDQWQSGKLGTGRRV